YERLILDAMRGDHTLFTTAEGIERLWEVSMPLLEAPPPVRLYPPGDWGPKSIHQLVAPHAWRLPFERVWRNPNPAGGCPLAFVCSVGFCTASGLTALTSGGPGRSPQHENCTGSNQIGENLRSTQRWNDVPRGTMDEMSSYVRLNLPLP